MKNDKQPSAKAKANDETGRFAYNGLERVIHERARLSIMASLAAHPDGLLFGDLKELCALTDGNLSRHLDVLKEAGLLDVWKGMKNNRPQTLCRLSDVGHERFSEYINVLENVVTDAAKTAAARGTTAKKLNEGWSPV